VGGLFGEIKRSWRRANADIELAMELKIQKWGNSAAVRLPAVLLEQMHASVGSSLNAAVRSDGVLLTLARRKYSLDELVAQCDPKAPLPVDLDAWGAVKPVGREAGSGESSSGAAVSAALV
jgi:antitoxin ChpS